MTIFRCGYLFVLYAQMNDKTLSLDVFIYLYYMAQMNDNPFL